VLVACRGDAVIGYAYGSLEERDWYRLLDAHGAIHDILVEEDARRSGAGRALVTGIVAALEKLGARRIVLSTHVDNAAAQRLFEACGFRATMIEMTR
jgi:ribosomal protein S18 acetylase RimI-like enzyme